MCIYLPVILKSVTTLPDGILCYYVHYNLDKLGSKLLLNRLEIRNLHNDLIYWKPLEVKALKY